MAGAAVQAAAVGSFAGGEAFQVSAALTHSHSNQHAVSEAVTASADCCCSGVSGRCMLVSGSMCACACRTCTVAGGPAASCLQLCGILSGLVIRVHHAFQVCGSSGDQSGELVLALFQLINSSRASIRP